jgi:hypothetical protein
MTKNAKGSNQYSKRSKPPGSIVTLTFDLTTASSASKETIARRPDLDPDTFAYLAADNDPLVRLRVAQNVSTPMEILEILSSDASASGSSEDIKGTIANRMDVSPSILCNLAKDANPRIRQTVATNHTCPPEAFAELMRDPVLGVRKAAANNPSFPDNLRAIISLGD